MIIIFFVCIIEKNNYFFEKELKYSNTDYFYPLTFMLFSSLLKKYLRNQKPVLNNNKMNAPKQEGQPQQPAQQPAQQRGKNGGKKGGKKGGK